MKLFVDGSEIFYIITTKRYQKRGHKILLWLVDSLRSLKLTLEDGCQNAGIRAYKDHLTVLMFE